MKDAGPVLPFGHVMKTHTNVDMHIFLGKLAVS